MKIGHKIRTLRELKGFSQEFMSEKLNLSVNSYGRLERGETQLTLNRLEEIAEVLEMGIAELLSFDNQSYIFHTVHQINTVSGTYNSFEKEIFEAKIEAQNKVIEGLTNEVAHLKKIVELLERQKK